MKVCTREKLSSEMDHFLEIWGNIHRIGALGRHEKNKLFLKFREIDKN